MHKDQKEKSCADWKEAKEYSTILADYYIVSNI